MSTPKRDSHSGRMDTGHEWNGIRELNTPVPKIVWFFYIITTLYAIVAWILLPAWPTGDSYTPGILGHDQRVVVEQDVKSAIERRSDWERQFQVLSVEEIETNDSLINQATNHGKRLFEDNCAMCHGRTGEGADGFPNLTDESWLWGGEPETILETLRVGINASHEETRISEMLAFGRDQILEQSDIRLIAQYVATLSIKDETGRHLDLGVDQHQAGAQLFEENCSTCHGESGGGIAVLGAPNLTDTFWLYGGELNQITRTINHGRQGVMPSWEGRLSESDRKILTVFVRSLSEKKER